MIRMIVIEYKVETEHGQYQARHTVSIKELYADSKIEAYLLNFGFGVIFFVRYKKKRRSHG